jgi:hypothetical protein
MPAGATNSTGSPRGESNAYAAARETAYGVPNNSYGGVPAYRTPGAGEENGYMDSPWGTYAPPLHASEDNGLPDPRRIDHPAPRDYRPDTGPPESFWLGQNGPGLEEQVRHNRVEFVDADGWEMVRGTDYSTHNRMADNPRLQPVPESRPTQLMSPNNYVYTRPFDATLARRFNGHHFSMADHRRTYPVFGMAPVFTRRNTYRADPAPWDTGIVDYPDNSPYYTGMGGQIQPGQEVASPVNRAWRLT